VRVQLDLSKEKKKKLKHGMCMRPEKCLLQNNTVASVEEKIRDGRYLINDFSYPFLVAIPNRLYTIVVVSDANKITICNTHIKALSQFSTIAYC
jgi:hypothetical protein